MKKFYLSFLMCLLFAALTPSSFAQNKVVVIPLDSQRPALEVVDAEGRTIGAATGSDLVAMTGDLSASKQRPVFLLPIMQDGFFSPDDTFGVFYSGNNCTGTAKILIDPSDPLPAFEVANVGFDPEAGPHALNVALSQIRAFVRVRPTNNVGGGFNSAASLVDGEWQCISIPGIGIAGIEVEMVSDLSQFKAPLSVRSR